jgi:acyl-CoA dehydrogenase
MEGRRMNTANSTTDFSTEDLQSLQTTVERFAKQAIAPHVPAWEEAGQFDRSLYTQAAELGLLGLGYPEHLGGTPAPWRARNMLSQTLARHGGSGGVMASLFSHNIGLPPVMAHGSAELQADVVPPVLRGERIAALAITEPGGGSDVAALKTTAVRDGDHYVVNGEKTFKAGATFDAAPAADPNLVVDCARTISRSHTSLGAPPSRLARGGDASSPRGRERSSR